jgi:membrane-bound ClpP family serine protease
MLPPKNPMVKVLLSVLAFEAIVFGLAIPGMIQVSDVPVTTAFVAGFAAMALALTAAALLRHPVGWALGWATQVVVIGFGVLTPMMFWLGALFATLWVTTIVLGRRLAARPATPPAQPGGQPD